MCSGGMNGHRHVVTRFYVMLNKNVVKKCISDDIFLLVRVKWCCVDVIFIYFLYLISKKEQNVVQNSCYMKWVCVCIIYFFLCILLWVLFQIYFLLSKKKKERLFYRRLLSLFSVTTVYSCIFKYNDIK